MTRAEFIARFPHASEAVIRANCSDFVRQQAPAPTLACQNASGRKETPKATTPAEPKKPRKGRVPRTRNAGTWTEAEFWSRIRSCLRRMSVYWKPARQALLSARVPFSGPRGQKWAFLCSDCGKLYARKAVQIDHIVPCGTLTDFEHMGEFLSRLLPEDPHAFAVRCRRCHQIKTNAEREARALRAERA